LSVRQVYLIFEPNCKLVLFCWSEISISYIPRGMSFKLYLYNSL